MSQVNVSPPTGPPYHDPYGDRAAAAGINLVALVLVIVVLLAVAVVAWGAFAGHWFGPSSGGNTNITVQQPRGQMPSGSVQVQSPGTTSTVPSPSRSPSPSR